MKHLKKVVAWVLAFSLVLSLSTVAFSAVSDSVRFLAAVQKTNQKLRSDQEKLWEAFGDSEKLMQNFLTAPYDLNISADAEIETDYTVLKNVGFDMLAKYNVPDQELAANMNVALSDGTDSAEAGMNVYMSDEKMALNIPQLFEEYLTMNLTEENEVSALMPYGLSGLVSATFGSIEDSVKLYSKDSLQAFEDRYNEVFFSLLGEIDPSAFNAAPAGTVNTASGAVTCDAITLTLSAENLNTIMDKFADTYAADPWIKTLYGTMFQSYAAMGIMDSEEMIETIAQSLRDINFESGMDLTVYINEEGYILRYAADFVVDGDPVQVIYDQKGQDALTDDIEMRFLVEQDDKFFEVLVTCVSNSLPENGPLTADLKVSYNINDEKKVDLLGFSYSYDMEKESDNLSYAIDFNGDFDMTGVTTADSAGAPSYEEDYAAYLEFYSYLSEEEGSEGMTEEPMTYEEYVAEMESYSSSAVPVFKFKLSGTGTAVGSDTASKFVLTDNKFEMDGIAVTFDFAVDMLPSTEAIVAVPEGAKTMELIESMDDEAFNTAASANLEKLMLDFGAVLE